MKHFFIIVSVALSVLSCAQSPDARQPAPAAGNSAGPADTETLAPNYEGLIRNYQSILAQDPRNIAALIATGNAYYDSGQWKKAIAMYERVLSLDPRNADVRTDMGTAFRNIGMFDQAVVEYHRALMYEPGHANARYNLGIVYAHDKKDYRDAIQAWEELLKLAPNHPQADSIRAQIAELKMRLAAKKRTP